MDKKTKSKRKSPSVVRIPVATNEHYLSNSGYFDIKNMSTLQRHNALKKAINHLGHVYVIRALVARSNLLSRTNPSVSKLMKDDQEWTSNQYINYKKMLEKKAEKKVRMSVRKKVRKM